MKTIFLLIAFCPLVLLAQTVDRELNPAQAEVVNTERMFARMGAEKGMRESFLTYFADEAVAFTPNLVNAKDDLRKQPEEKPPLSYTLNWWPTQGDISVAADLAYNTGPVRVDFKDNPSRPPQHSVFFSIWKKQRNGAWRVVLDLGVGVPSSIAALDAPFQPARKMTAGTKYTPVNVEDESAKLLARDKQFLDDSAKTTLGAAMPRYMDDSGRVHRPGVLPIIGRTALNSWAETQTMRMDGAPIKADVSASGDLGYTYGRFEMTGSRNVKGHYARVWRRDSGAEWKIVVDVIIPSPPQI